MERGGWMAGWLAGWTLQMEIGRGDEGDDGRAAIPILFSRRSP
jgi:hypothetical protein